jgi:hypothetical protein
MHFLYDAPGRRASTLWRKHQQQAMPPPTQIATLYCTFTSESSSGMLRQTVYCTFTSESSHGVLRQIKTMVYSTQLSICCSSNVAVSTLVYNTRVGDGVDLTERSQNAATFCTNLCALCILCSTERRLQPCSIRRPPNDASRSRFRLRRVHRFCG